MEREREIFHGLYGTWITRWLLKSRAKEVFSQPKSRKIQGDLTIISYRALRKISSGSCSHYFSWRYLAVIDTRFLAPSLLIIGERHHEMCLPLSSLRSWIGSCQIFASCRSEAELSVWKQRSIRASSDFSTTIIPLKKGAPCHVLRRQQVKCLQQWQLTMHEHSVWKLLKKSHFTTLRAKRVTFVYKFILMIFGV